MSGALLIGGEVETPHPETLRGFDLKNFGVRLDRLRV